jgi:hypothetical protein
VWTKVAAMSDTIIEMDETTTVMNARSVGRMLMNDLTTANG